MVPVFVPSVSQLALSLADQESVRLDVDFRVMDAVVELLPISTVIGEASSHESRPPASNVDWTSTGEEESQAAAIAEHTLTSMAARRARLTDDFT